jgi:hypothetical protein
LLPGGGLQAGRGVIMSITTMIVAYACCVSVLGTFAYGLFAASK